MKKFRSKSLKKKYSGTREVREALLSFKERLKGPKPGLRAQLQMITNPRPGHKVFHEVEATCIKAGVLVLLYPWKDELYFVLTRRTIRLDHHQAQISFPGGRQEEGEDLQQTALREACEELDVRPGSIRILGELTPLYIPPSNFCIYPVVAATERRPDFRPSTEEVAEVIEMPLNHLLDNENIHREMRTIRGTEVEVPFYSYKGHKIWGATAMVLAELLHMFKEECP